jgi:predicted GIY-YIG superfamily endonuclease
MNKITFYKITCNITGECYIGKTSQDLEARISHHKGIYNPTRSQ